MPGSSNGSAPTPPSAPSSAPEADGAAPAARRRGGVLLLAVAAAAIASCWNPIGAPFAALAGVIVAALAVRRAVAPRAGEGRAVAAATLALGAGAAVAGVLVLLGTLGVGFRPEEKLDLPVRTPAETGRLLDEAAGRTRGARERARRELDQLPPEPAPPAERDRGAAPAR